MNNVYLARDNFLQLGNPVSAPHSQFPPGKKRKDRLKVEKMIFSKEAEAAAKEGELTEAATLEAALANIFRRTSSKHSRCISSQEWK